MIGKKVEKAFNEQIKHEMESSYLYLAVAAWFQSIALDGMAHWMRVQAQEETGHAMRFFDHIEKRTGRVALSALAQPKFEWSSPLEAFKDAYAHEQFITGRIAELVKLAQSEGDSAAESFLKWFVDEQVEEEKQTLDIVNMFERLGDSRSGLIMLDFKLSERK